MTDEIELLRRFRGELPGPSTDAWVRARSAIAAAAAEEGLLVSPLGVTGPVFVVEDRKASAPVTIRTRRRRSGRWTHRILVVAVAAAILVVFFVPLPRVSLFRRIVAPTHQPTPTSAPKEPLPRAQVVLPTRYTFTAINQVGSVVELTGLDVPSTNTNPPADAKCVSAKLDHSTLRLYDIVVARCAAEGSGSSLFWVIQSGDYTDHATARIAHRNRSTGNVILGPVVMTWTDASNSHLQTIIGDGSLWLFDAGTTKGAEVLRVSEESGLVENTIVIPGGLERPILATDEDGLWMGVATNGGYARGLPGSPVYHIAVGSNVAKVVFTGGRATFWVVASGHTLWDDVLTVATPGGQVTQAIWRFDGPQARRVFHTNTELPFGVTVIGNKAEGLWTVASQLPAGAGPNADTDINCTGIPAVVYINPDTGSQRVETTLPYGSAESGYGCQAEDLGQNQGVLAAADLYLLDGTTGASGPYTELFRIPAKAPAAGKLSVSPLPKTTCLPTKTGSETVVDLTATGRSPGSGPYA